MKILKQLEELNESINSLNHATKQLQRDVRIVKDGFDAIKEDVIDIQTKIRKESE